LITSFFKALEERLAQGFWFRRGLAATVLAFCWHLTDWGASFAEKALTSKADLMAVAAVIGAVAAIPLGLLTLLFNKYVEGRNDVGNGS
jgi:ABC-type nitrate/sulfonate/bicarbonate transport system permease component